ALRALPRRRVLRDGADAGVRVCDAGRRLRHPGLRPGDGAGGGSDRAAGRLGRARHCAHRAPERRGAASAARRGCPAAGTRALRLGEAGRAARGDLPERGRSRELESAPWRVPAPSTEAPASMIKVLTVFGTRPEAIKLAPVIRELERRSDTFEARICVTGQHRELLDGMLDLFDIRPHYDLDIMREDQSLTDVTVAVLDGLRQVFQIEEPDWVLVQGDTTTTMAGGLGAFYHGCRVAHVEAGLRTFDQRDPW